MKWETCTVYNSDLYVQRMILEDKSQLSSQLSFFQLFFQKQKHIYICIFSNILGEKKKGVSLEIQNLKEQTVKLK